MLQIFAIGICVLWTIWSAAAAAAQASATPVSAVLSTATPDAPPIAAPTITPSPIPTVAPAPRLQALASAGNVNVRALPDIESEILGTIAHGAEYLATRKYFRWYELRYDESPNGRAWVYGDLVNISGDAARIETVDDANVIAAISQSFAEESLPEAPDAAGDARTVRLATAEPERSDAVTLMEATRLPTFTPPAPTRAPFGDQLNISEQVAEALPDLAPIAPIVALAGLGSLGLLISLLRG